MIVATWNITLKHLHLVFALILLLVIAFPILHLTRNTINVDSPENLVIFKQHENLTTNSTIPTCNLFSGRWVYDDVSYPLYKEGKCSFHEPRFFCEKNGRNNLRYQNWRWQPYHCDLPRFNGTALFEKLRDKKLIFVGDSLGRNQWRSLLCLIEQYLPLSTNKNPKLEGNSMYVHVKDYNATIEFYWAPFLVESNNDGIIHHNAEKRIVRIKSIEEHGRHWINADVLIFDSFAWWGPNITMLWSPFDNRDAVYKDVSFSFRPYEIALNTWADWLEFNIDIEKTKIFFTSLSPYPSRGSIWGIGEACYNVTEPILGDTQMIRKSSMKIVESTIEKLEERGVKVVYLNITQLSSHRTDAHPSIYTEKLKKLHPNPNKITDCLHWCLPGVPDVWNQILYAYIMNI